MLEQGDRTDGDDEARTDLGHRRDPSPPAGLGGALLQEPERGAGQDEAEGRQGVHGDAARKEARQLDDAVKELEHCASLGLKGVTLNTFPSGHGYPTPEDDRFWAAALDLNIALAKHGGGRFQGSKRGEPRGVDAPLGVSRHPGALAHEPAPWSARRRRSQACTRARTCAGRNGFVR